MVVHNVLYDKTVIEFGHDGSGRAVRTCSFSTGQGEPALAVGTHAY